VEPPRETYRDAVTQHRDRWGLPLGIGAFAIWGGMPLFFPLLQPAGAIEVVANRIVWSLVFCLIALAVLRQLGDFRTALRSPRTLGTLAAASALVVVNWVVYVHAVLTDRVIDAALGYFINPVITVLLGVLILRERLRPVQWVAVACGVASVVVLSTGLGGLPWISLCLALSFGLYGLVKNRVGRTVQALPGLAVETVVATPFAIAYLVWLGDSGTFTGHGVGHSLLLMSAGVITALPLLMFSAAARRLPLSVVGMLQYLAPALQFLVGLLVFGEHMPPARWVGFFLVWVALVLLTADGIRQARTVPRVH
jgi:chloramphenicol-sensitive protein RarD